jgi:uncharacterized protein DUF5677
LRLQKLRIKSIQRNDVRRHDQSQYFVGLRHRKSYMDIIECAKEWIRLCRKYKDAFSSEFGGKSLHQETRTLLITTLWLRLIENFEGIIAVVSAKTPTSGYIILRSMTEAYILMRKAIEDDAFYRVYFNHYHSSKLKRLSRIEKVYDKVQFSFNENEIENLKAHFKEQIQSDLPSEYQIKKVFYDLGEFDLYEKVYGHCSSYTHCDVGTLDMFLDETEKGPILVLNKFVERDTILICMMAADLFHRSFLRYSQFLKVESTILKTFVDEFNSLHDKSAVALKPVPDGSQI